MIFQLLAFGYELSYNLHYYFPHYYFPLRIAESRDCLEAIYELIAFLNNMKRRAFSLQQLIFLFGKLFIDREQVQV